MADRESRKRKATELGAQYQQDVAKSAVKAENSKKSRTIGKEINTDLADMFGNMKASDEPPAAMDVDIGQGRRRRTRKGSKKSRKGRKKTRKH